jgi:DNA-directed RNA polymerase subunit omega
MLDIDLEEALIKKVGGKFALTTLIQRRMVELNRGAPPMVRMENSDSNLRLLVCQEILEGKISLESREEAILSEVVEKERIEAAGQVSAPPPAPPKEDEGEVYGSDIKKIKEQRIKELAQLLNPKK